MADHHGAEGGIEHAGNAPLPVVRTGKIGIDFSSIWCAVGFGTSLLIIPLSYVAPALIARYVLLFEENCRTIMIMSSILSLCGIGMTIKIVPSLPYEDRRLYVPIKITEEAIGDESISIFNGLALANTLRRFGVGLWVGMMTFGLVKMIK